MLKHIIKVLIITETHSDILKVTRYIPNTLKLLIFLFFASQKRSLPEVLNKHITIAEEINDGHLQNYNGKM